jgi:hypothetical protein
MAWTTLTDSGVGPVQTTVVVGPEYWVGVPPAALQSKYVPGAAVAL